MDVSIQSQAGVDALTNSPSYATKNFIYLSALLTPLHVLFRTQYTLNKYLICYIQYVLDSKFISYSKKHLLNNMAIQISEWLK